MIRVSKIGFAPFIISLILVIGCTNEDAGDAAFKEILSQPAFAALTDSIKQNPKDAGMYFRRGQLLQQNGYELPAVADYKKAWSLEKNEKYALSISDYLSEKRPDSAIGFLNEALSSLPKSLFLRLSLAQAYSDAGKTDDALKTCNEIIEQEPREIDALMLKSDLLDKKGDASNAVATLEQAYHLAPFDEELCNNLAFKYAQSKNPKALTLCDSLIKTDTAGKTPEPYYFKGVYYYNINDKAKALDLFTQCIAHNFNFLDAYLEKGRILYEQKKYADALKVVRLATTVSPSYADAYLWIAKCQQAMNQRDEARLNYQRAYGLDKTLTEAKDSADKLK